VPVRAGARLLVRTDQQLDSVEQRCAVRTGLQTLDFLDFHR
jgi:hypothetical protein